MKRRGRPGTPAHIAWLQDSLVSRFGPLLCVGGEGVYLEKYAKRAPKSEADLSDTNMGEGGAQQPNQIHPHTRRVDGHFSNRPVGVLMDQGAGGAAQGVSTAEYLAQTTRTCPPSNGVALASSFRVPTPHPSVPGDVAGARAVVQGDGRSPAHQRPQPRCHGVGHRGSSAVTGSPPAVAWVPGLRQTPAT